MNNEKKPLPNRKRNRLRGYDYSNSGVYFITICTQGRKCRLSNVGEGFPLPQLTVEGQIIKKWIENIHITHPDIFVDAYVIMPNHIHLLLAIRNVDGRENPSPTINHVMGRLKYCATKEINAYHHSDAQKFFQRSFHDHIIRGDKDYEKIHNYIMNNPAKWKHDCFYRAE